MNFYEKLKYICEERDISLYSIEKGIGMSKGSFAKWGKSSPSIDNVEKIANYLDVSLDYLLGRTTNDKSHKEVFVNDCNDNMKMERLKELRKALKLTQSDIAAHLGVTVSAYGNYELGQREPDNKTLVKLANFFHVSIDYLLKRTDIPDFPQVNAIPQFPDLINKYSALNKEGRQKVDVYINDLDERYKIKKIIHHTKKVVPAS